MQPRWLSWGTQATCVIFLRILWDSPWWSLRGSIFSWKVLLMSGNSWGQIELFERQISFDVRDSRPLSFPSKDNLTDKLDLRNWLKNKTAEQNQHLLFGWSDDYASAGNHIFRFTIWSWTIRTGGVNADSNKIMFKLHESQFKSLKAFHWGTRTYSRLAPTPPPSPVIYSFISLKTQKGGSVS